MNKEQIIEYIEAGGQKFYLDDYSEVPIRRVANAIQVLEKIKKDYGRLKRIIYYSDAPEVIFDGFNVFRYDIKLVAPKAKIVMCCNSQIISLEAPNAIKVDCSYNSLTEINLPKAKKIDCKNNLFLERITAPNCEEISLRINCGYAFCDMPKENVKVAPNCKIAGTDVRFYSYDFYAYLEDSKGKKVVLPVQYDGSVKIYNDNLHLVFNDINYNIEEHYSLITNTKYIKVSNLPIISITAPNCEELSCNNCLFSSLELPKAVDIYCPNNPLVYLYAPKAYIVDCSYTLLEKIDLPLVIDLNCSDCENLVEVSAPIYEKIDFRGCENLNRKNINKNKY